VRLVAFSALTLAYPGAIWLLSGKVAPRWLALVPALLGVLRLSTGHHRGYVLLGAAALVMAGLTGALDRSWPLRWYPVMVNASLLVLFGVTLVRGPSMAERLARLRRPELPPHAIAYTRRVTIVWCVFFAVNGSIAALTAIFGTDAQWAAWNGCLAYVLMGLLAAGEYLVRRRLQKKVTHG
jgi:uncharacterized membrane protein